jgi:hypothetical protein
VALGPKPTSDAPTDLASPSWVAPPTAAPAKRSRAYLLGFLPLVLFLLFAIGAPGFYAPMFDTTVQTGGQSLGVPLLVAAALFMLAGVAIMWRFPTALGVAVGVVCCTFPSLFLVIIGPAICLIAQNLD